MSTNKQISIKIKAMEHLLKSGDVLHCSSKRWLPRLIQWFTKSRINHTALVVNVLGELFIIDSQKDGTNLRPIEQWEKKYNYKYIVHRPIAFSPHQLQRAIHKIGSTSYDFASLFLWQPLYIITGKWHGKSKGKAENRMYCSEYVAWVFMFPGWWKLSPQAVFEYMNDSPFFILVQDQ
jgi:hypothetical protein